MADGAAKKTVDLQARFPLTEFQGSENAQVVLDERYRKQIGKGNFLETHTQIFERVTKTLGQSELMFNDDGQAEARRQEFERDIFTLQINQVFMFNTPMIVNAGKPGWQGAACFVQPVNDTFSNGKDGIYDTLKNMAIIHQTGGGTGFNWSRLRPMNDLVGVMKEGADAEFAKGVASGPVSFMTLYDASTKTTIQGGVRRGANMGILNCDHPDIMTNPNIKGHVGFIDCKKDNDGKSVIANFNISVGIKDSFMEALERGDTAYPLINPRSGKQQGSINPQELWKTLGFRAWQKADPGVFFIDRANYFHQVPGIEPIEATNPCGEVPLVPNEPCNLGSLAVSRFVRAGAVYDRTKSVKAQYDKLIDRDLLRKAVHVVVRGLDNVVAGCTYPTPQIQEAAMRTRKLGLGVMGWANLLLILRMRYASQEAVELAELLMADIQGFGREMSSQLARERGNFPAWEQSVFGPNPEYNQRTWAGGAGVEIPMRNATITCIAPTGSISMIADEESGCEPMFAIAMVKKCLGDKTFPYVNENAMSILVEHGVEMTKELRQELCDVGYLDPAVFGNRDWFKALPEYVIEMLYVSKQIHWEWHLKHQAAFQKHTCLAVSKTINCAEDTTPEEIEQIYLMAYKLGCKGTTIYRENSLQYQVLNMGQKKDETPKAPEPVQLVKAQKRPRPEIINGTTTQIPTGCGPMNVTVNEDEQGAFEVFAITGKGGGCVAAQVEAQGRLISLALRYGVPYEEIVAQLQGIRCPKPVMAGGGNFTLSCGDAIAKGMKRIHDAKTARAATQAANEVKATVLATSMPKMEYHGPNDCPNPDCGGVLTFAEGCVKCLACGHSECGG